MIDGVAGNCVPTFMGTFFTVTTAAGQNVNVNITAQVEVLATVVSSAQNYQIIYGACYSPSGSSSPPLPIQPVTGFFQNDGQWDPSSVGTIHIMLGDTASAVLGAGTWAVGFCDCAFPSGITIDSVSHGYVQVTN